MCEHVEIQYQMRVHPAAGLICPLWEVVSDGWGQGNWTWDARRNPSSLTVRYLFFNSKADFVVAEVASPTKNIFGIVENHRHCQGSDKSYLSEGRILGLLRVCKRSPAIIQDQKLFFLLHEEIISKETFGVVVAGKGAVLYCYLLVSRYQWYYKHPAMHRINTTPLIQILKIIQSEISITPKLRNPSLQFTRFFLQRFTFTFYLLELLLHSLEMFPFRIIILKGASVHELLSFHNSGCKIHCTILVAIELQA